MNDLLKLNELAITVEELEKIIREIIGWPSIFERTIASEILNEINAWTIQEKDVDSMILEKIAFYSGKDQPILRETYATLCEINDVVDRVNMKEAFCEYLEKGDIAWEYEEQEVNSIIEDSINCFWGMDQPSFRETYAKICQIKDLYDRENMKVFFCDYIQSYEEVIEYLDE